MDALSHLLRALRVQNASFSLAPPAAPPAAAEPSGADLRAVAFYAVLEGEFTLSQPGAAPVAMKAGDAVLVTHGGAHAVAECSAYGHTQPRLLAVRMGCDRVLCTALLGRLPGVLPVRLDTQPGPTWLQVALWQAQRQAGSEPGLGGIRTKAAELLLTEVLRQQLHTDQLASGPYARGLTDRVVGACLAAMHAQPADAWTLESLARRANSSRSVLAERFKELMGEPPMAYLAHWRMALAAQLLRETRLPIDRVAEQVGYETDTAFSRAFSRHFGMPPATWRRTQLAAAATPEPAPVAARAGNVTPMPSPAPRTPLRLAA